MFYQKKAITREVYDFALREGYADANLIAKWKKVKSVKEMVLKSRAIRNTRNVYFISLYYFVLFVL